LEKLKFRAGIVVTAVIGVLIFFWYMKDILQDTSDKLTDPITGVSGIEDYWMLEWVISNVGWIVFAVLVIGFAGYMGWYIYKDRGGR